MIRIRVSIPTIVKDRVLELHFCAEEKRKLKKKIKKK
jgi:hypothetical protein